MTSFSLVGNFTHALSCQQILQPMVGNIGTIGCTNDTNGRTLDGIGVPIALLAEPRTNAKFFRHYIKLLAKVKIKIQGVSQSQTAANPRHQEEEKNDKN